LGIAVNAPTAKAPPHWRETQDPGRSGEVVDTDTPAYGPQGAELERLRSIAALSDAELGRSLDGGWTVAALLAHVAYWEGRQLGAIEAWQRHGVPPAWWTLPEANAVNALRLELWLATPAREAVERAIATAEALNRVMDALPAATLAQLPQRRQDPGAHRADHLDEIERAVSR
jgi:hypothetical protein